MENVNLVTKRPFKRFVKWFGLIVLIILVGYGVLILVDPQSREWVSAMLGQKLLQRSVDNYAKEVKKDKFGGKTPLETYMMFVEALKNEDIDLASKYFIKEKQSEYKEFFEEIKKAGKWDLMMKDVLAERNLKGGEYLGDAAYSLEVTGEDKFVSATVSIVLPLNLSGQPISDIWKIERF